MQRQDQSGVVTVRPARMLGWIMLFAFASILLTTLVDPESMSFGSALPLLAITIVPGVTETWGNYVRVDCRAITRVNWAGFTSQRIAIADITGVYREDQTSWFGRERPYVVIESAGTQIHLGFNMVYRDGGWPIDGLARIVLALAECGAPIDATLLADSRQVAG